MRNIIITGGGMVNKGAQAMTLIAVHELRERFPEHEIYLYSPVDMQNTQLDKTQFWFEFTGWYPLKFARCQKKPLLRTVTLLRNKRELLEAESIYRNTEFIVDISGYALGSNWSDKICNDFLDVLEFAQGFDIPVYLMPQSFGPFDFGEERKRLDARIRKLLPSVKMIYAREQEGYDALVNTYGLNNVSMAVDLVLANKGINLRNVYKKQLEICIPDILPHSVAVIPNSMNASVSTLDRMVAVYSEIIGHFLTQKKNVYLLSHSAMDADLCKKLKEQFVSDQRVILLEQDFSCLEFNELVKRFDYLVASRFHSIVHAYKNGIPCVILGWAKKYEDLSVLFDQHGYLFDVRNSPDVYALTAAMDALNQHRDEESAKILSHLSAVQQHNVFDILKL